MASTLHSYCIFCDDVRQEISGKSIFIGVYRDQMLFPGPAPWVHPQLMCHFVLRVWRENEMPKIALEIRAENADETVTLVHVDVPHESLDIPTAPKFDFEGDKRQMLQAAFTIGLAPLQFDRATKLTAVAIIDGEEEQLERLRIMQNPQAPASPVSAR